MSNHLETALTHSICPICCTETDYQIVLNTTLTKAHADRVKEMHGKATGFSEPCKECQTKIDEGWVALIGIDPEKSSAKDGHVALKDVYRTGKFVWLKRQVAEDVFKEEGFPFFLLEDEVFDKLGILFPPESEDKNGS